MNENDRKEFQELKKMVHSQNELLQKLNRGWYGDEDNAIPGGLERLQNVETFIQKLTNAKWYASGIIAVVVLLASFIYGIVRIAESIWNMIQTG